MNMFLAFLADSGTGDATSQLLSLVLPVGALFIVFYFVLLRPERKRKKQVEELRSSIEVGDKITTIGGIIGKVVAVKDDEITIETSHDKNKMQFARWAVQSKEEKEKA